MTLLALLRWRYDLAHYRAGGGFLGCTVGRWAHGLGLLNFFSKKIKRIIY